jgi:hypothetical protein
VLVFGVDGRRKYNTGARERRVMGKVARLARDNAMWGQAPPRARVSVTHGLCVGS